MALISSGTTDQSGSEVGQDQAGRDVIKNTTVNNFFDTTPVGLSTSQVPKLLQKLATQMAGQTHHDGFIAELELYVNNRSSQTVVGLEDKLKQVGRHLEYGDALLKKEAFSKMLLKLQHWEAAQQLFAYFLSMIEVAFKRKIIPHCSSLSQAEIEDVIGEHIVDKIKHEIGSGHEEFIISDLHIQGMIFWLADKCYVRWHQ